MMPRQTGSRSAGKKSQNPRIRLGQQGEEQAKDYLKERGFKIIETNYRLKFGEIDIIAKDDDIFVFVEVKTKSTKAYGEPEEMINYKKKRKLIRLAKGYLQDKEISNVPFRIDVISVILKDEVRIKHFKSAIQDK